MKKWIPGICRGDNMSLHFHILSTHYIDMGIICRDFSFRVDATADILYIFL